METLMRKQRRCLGPCGKVFWSKGPGNRLCDACNRRAKSFTGYEPAKDPRKTDRKPKHFSD